MKREKHSLLLKNAALITFTSFVLRGTGMFLRIYVSARLGAHGVGLHQLILSVYTLGSGFALSGISAAVTRLSAAELAKGDQARARAVVRRCTFFSLAFGLLSAGVIYAFARPIGEGWLSDPRTVMSIRICALILPVISVSACVRGYFVARRRIGANSAGQLSEQAARTVLTVVLLRRMLPMGIEYGCAALLLADLIAESVCTAVVSAEYLIDALRERRGGVKRRDAPPALDRAIWDVAAPITASHYLTSLLRTVESTLVPDCLTVFEHDRGRALELFGMVRGMTLPLLLFPATVIMAFSSLIVPELSRAQALGDRAGICRGVGRTMRVTFTVGILAAGLFLMYPDELGMIFYKEPELGGIISALAPFAPLMYAESMAVAVLGGLGGQKASLVYGVIDSVVRISLISLLVPRMGLRGFILVMAVSNILTPALHLRRLARCCGMRMDAARWIFEPALCMALAFAGARLAEGALPHIAQPLPRAAAGCALAAIIFAALLLLLQEDLSGAAASVVRRRLRVNQDVIS